MNFIEYSRAYLQNEEELIKALRDLEPILRKRSEMEKMEPKLKNLRAVEIQYSEVEGIKKEKLEKAKKKKEDEAKKRKAEEEMDRLHLARRSRGNVDPPKSTSTMLDPDSSNQTVG